MSTPSSSSRCRVCQAGDLLSDVLVLDGRRAAAASPPVFPTPCLCAACGLLQLNRALPLPHHVSYRSGASSTARSHLQAYIEQLRGKVSLAAGDAVLDIGSNDGTFLRFYPDTLRRVGCDPAGKQFAALYEGLELVPACFTKEGVAALGGVAPRFKAVSSVAVFNDVPDPVLFARDVASVLDDEGLWTLEQSYVLTMLQRSSIDTICHEHLEYYGLRQIRDIMQRAGLKVSES